MGALARATRRELEAEVAQNPEFWEDVLAGIADGVSLKVMCRDHAWAFGEVYRWIRADEKLSAAYDAALQAKAEGLVHDAVDRVGEAQVEDVQVAKLVSDVAFRAAGKWDRARYGEKMDVNHGGLVPTLVIEIGGGSVARVGEKDVTPKPVVVEAVQVLED